LSHNTSLFFVIDHRR